MARTYDEVMREAELQTQRDLVEAMEEDFFIFCGCDCERGLRKGKCKKLGKKWLDGDEEGLTTRKGKRGRK